MRLNLILAEDDPAMRRWLSKILAGMGSISEASTGNEALWLLGTQRQVDAVISDVRMPSLTGLQLLRAARLAGFNIPFLLITAFGDDEVCSEALRLGATVLSKPFSAQELLEQIRHLGFWE
ncbi:MAG TPA: response regulator [Polyangiaceae bacterium]|nr:response regulator [Polyangiaceae bacterium]